MLPLFPTAVRRLDVGGFDTVVSSSSAFAHGIRPGTGREARLLLLPLAVPLRLARAGARALRGAAPVRPPMLDFFLRRHRPSTAARASADRFLATGEIARERSAASGAATPRCCTRRSRSTASRRGARRARPVRGPSWSGPSAPRWGSRRRRRGRRIKVVGNGARAGRLRERYGHAAEFLGRVDDERLAGLYSEAAALVVPNVEEFGIAAVRRRRPGARWSRSTRRRRGRYFRARPACSSPRATGGGAGCAAT